MDLREARGNVQGTVQATTARRRLLGDLLIREGLITPAQLKEALQTQTELGNYTPLGQLLVDQKMITQEQLRVVLDKYNKKYRIGDLLVETNAISEEQLDLALQHQKKTGLRLGDVLLQLNFVTERQIKEALCKQLRIPFIDLDSVPIDTALTHLVSKGYAQRHRVLPISKNKNEITLVMDDPTDIDVVDELVASTGCRIAVVTSTSAAFQRVFARAYEASQTGSAEPRPELRQSTQDALRLQPQASQGPAAEPPGRDARPDDRVASAAALRSLEERYAATTRELAELRAEREALAGERQAIADALRQLADQNRVTREALKSLQVAHDSLRNEHEGTVRALRDLETRYAEAAWAIGELRGERERLLRQVEAMARALHELRARDGETVRALSELRGAYEKLCEEQEDASRALREQRDGLLRERQDFADALETVLHHLKA